MGRFILIGISLLLSINLLPAQELYFEDFGRDEGLPQSTVLDIVQDREGFLWFATEGGGVVRFDGLRMEHFSLPEGLVDNVIEQMAVSPDGTIWFRGERRGLSRFSNPGMTEFSRKKKNLPDVEVSALAILPDGQILLGTKTGKLLIQEEGEFKETPLKGFDRSDEINKLIPAGAGKTWMLTESTGLWELTGNPTFSARYIGLKGIAIHDGILSPSGKLVLATEKGISILDNGSIRSDSIAAPGGKYVNCTSLGYVGDQLWIGTESDGLFVQQTGGWKSLSSLSGFPKLFINKLFSDRSGNLWIGTRIGGVFRYSGDEIQRLFVGHGLPANDVTAIFRDRENNLWAGTKGNGIVRFGEKEILFNVERGLPSEMVLSVAEKPGGGIFLGTLGGLAWIDGYSCGRVKVKKAPIDFHIHKVLFDSDSTCWLATQSHGLVKAHILPKGKTAVLIDTLDRADGFPSTTVYDVEIGKDGTIWCATPRGLVKYRAGKAEIGSRRENFPENRINCIEIDAEGHLWVGTQGSGLIFIPDGAIGNTDGFTILDSRSGLPDGNIRGISFDTQGNLWIATETAVSALNLAAFRKRSEIRLTTLTKANGFRGKINNRNTVFTDPQGKIWFGTEEGAISIKPTITEGFNQPPKLVLKEVQLFRERVNWFALGQDTPESPLVPLDPRLKYNQNHLSFGISLLHFRDPASVAFRYRLADVEENWSSPTRDPVISYTNLPPGNYTLELQVRTGQGEWLPAETLFPFAIRPPWWQRWWFYLLMILVIGGGAYAFFQYRLAAIRRFNEQLQVEIEQRKITEMKLTETNQDLDTLLYRAAHDLKAPNDTAMGMLEIALSEVKEASMKQYLEMVQLCNNKLHLVVQNLLEITQIKQQKLNPREIIAAELAKDTWASLSQEEGFKEVKFSISGAENLKVFTDTSILKFALVNLFQNAIRYRNQQANPPEVKLELETINGERILRIRDNGIGIPGKALDHIFQMFYRGTDVAEGTGLGLYVVRIGIERLDGRISVSSKVGEGTTFSIVLPESPELADQ